MLIALIVVLSLAVLFFLTLYVVYYIVFRSPQKGQNDFYALPAGEQYQKVKDRMYGLVDKLLAKEYEEVFVTSYDGLKLYGRYYHYQDGAPLDIGFHGYRSTSIRDMSGGGSISTSLKHNLLIVDQRAHGKSEGKTITFGIKERYDCVAWINYAINRFGEDTQIRIAGVSMGATTVLLASGLNLPKNVFCIVADCPFSSPEKIIKKVVKDMKLPPTLLYPLIALSAKIFGGFSLGEVTVPDAIKSSKIPTIIIHGDDDRFVPKEMSDEILAVRPDFEHKFFKDSGHGLSYLDYPEEYTEVILDFVKRHKKS